MNSRVSIILVTVAALAACTSSRPPLAATAENAKPRTLLDTARARAAREGKSTVIEFGASWCRPCHFFKKYIAVGDDVRQAAAEVVFVSVECDAPDIKPACDPFELDGFPTFVILDRDGIERSRRSGLEGLSTPSAFARYLRAARDLGS